MKRGATRMLRAHRNGLSNVAALPIGDVLLYQSRGAEIRAFIRKKIEAAPEPVTVVAHSLGGIACVDLLAETGAPTIAQLVTAGSQAPLFVRARRARHAETSRHIARHLSVLAELVRSQRLPQLRRDATLHTA